MLLGVSARFRARPRVESDKLYVRGGRVVSLSLSFHFPFHYQLSATKCPINLYNTLVLTQHAFSYYIYFWLILLNLDCKVRFTSDVTGSSLFPLNQLLFNKQSQQCFVRLRTSDVTYPPCHLLQYNRDNNIYINIHYTKPIKVIALIQYNAY